MVSVLLVSVSVVARPTKVSVEVGSVSVPVLTIELITGVTNVGLVANTLEPVPVSSDRDVASCADVIEADLVLYKVLVPDGIVALEAAVEVSVKANAPAVISDEPVTSVRVAEVAGAVIVTLFIDVAVATPRTGVTKVGVVSTTNFEPVPVCEVIDVALPTEVITPVRLAFVTTVATFPTEVTPPVKLALVVTVAALPVTEPAIAFVTVRSVNQPLTIRVPVEPIIPLASVARSEAAMPGAEDEVIAWVWAVAVELVEDTVKVPGVAIVVANDPTPEPVTAPVRVIV